MNIIVDCQFDESTEIAIPAIKPIGSFQSEDLNPKQLADIFRSIKEGYLSGGVLERSRYYMFKELQLSTRCIADSWKSKLAGYIQEYLTGYGLRPGRVIIAMLATFLICLLIFASQLGLSDGLMLTAGAFFTFGAKADLVDRMGVQYKFLYVTTSFLGISFTALFITVLANIWFGRR